MAFCLHVLLVISSTLLLKANGHNNNYDYLDVDQKKYVDLAFKPAYTVYKDGHLNFDIIIGTPVIQPTNVLIDIRFRATKCAAPTSDGGRRHNKNCRAKTKPYINCRVCSPSFTSTEPFIDCAFQKDVGKRERIREQLCDFNKSGQGSVLSLKKEESQPRCLGCF